MHVRNTPGGIVDVARAVYLFRSCPHGTAEQVSSSICFIAAHTDLSHTHVGRRYLDHARCARLQVKRRVVATPFRHENLYLFIYFFLNITQRVHLYL